MRQFIDKLGGRKAFGFYLFFIVSVVFLIGWHDADSFKIDFVAWQNFMKWSFLLYIGGNLGEHVKNYFEKKVDNGNK